MTSFVYPHAGLKFAVTEIHDGPAMVFQHGLCGNASQTAEVFPAESGWRCLTLECRGHGRSDVGSPEQFSIATFAEDVASLIEAQALAPVVLGGISMGAAIALNIAVHRPELVRALVLARPAWITEAAPPNLQPYAVVGELLGLYPPDEARARFEASDFARQLQLEAPNNLASLLNFFSRKPLFVTRELLRRIAADGPDVSETKIKGIRVPTLVIAHTDDFVHPFAMAQTLSAMIPTAKMLEITSKVESFELYQRDFSTGISEFLKEVS